MLNVKVTRFAPIASTNAPKLKAMVDVEVGNNLMLYGLMYKLNKDNEYYVQMPQSMGRDGDYHSIIEPLSKEFAAKLKAEVEKANIEGEKYTPSEENSEPIQFNFTLKSGANNSYYGNLRVNDDLLIHNISIRERLDPETNKVVKFVSLPSKQADNGKWWSVVRPSNDICKDAINRYGILAIGKIAVEKIGNIEYKDLKEQSDDLSYYRYQNVNYAKKVGEELNKLGVKWSGKVEKTGAVITISADEADTYTRVIDAMREKVKSAEQSKEAVSENTENQIDFISQDEPYPF